MNGRRNISWGGDNNALIFLIAANLVIFLCMRMLFFILHDKQGSQLDDYLRVYENMAQPGRLGEFISKPWTLLTAPFSHISLRMLLSNMLWLFSFGFLMQNLGQNRHLFGVYLYGGLAAGITFLITGSLLPQLSNGAMPGLLEGAGPAVMAVAVAAVTLQPGYRIFPFIKNGIPVWWLLVLFVIINVSLLATSRPELLPAYVMAGLTGFWYAQGIKKGADYALWMRRLLYIFTGKNGGHSANRPQREQLFYTDTQVTPYEKKRKITQAVIDELLDKINRKGYGSLTAEEREILKKAKDEL